jgi:hypothetical protein
MDKPDHLKLVGMILPADAQEIRSCIDVLERALAEAREGRVLAVAISMVGAGNKIGFYSSETRRNSAKLLASSQLTVWRLSESMWHDMSVETEEYPDLPPDTG